MIHNLLNQSTHWAYSIKTRIKTWEELKPHGGCLLIEHIPLKQGLRPPSKHKVPSAKALIEHIPLKQGLRQPSTLPQLSRQTTLIEHIPLKQGLRHYLIFKWLILIFLIEHIPLKQGLRLYPVPLQIGQSIYLIEHIPLKQGLRLLYRSRSTKIRPSHWAYSIKTRIKTLAQMLFHS